jgi:hypothetical protein
MKVEGGGRVAGGGGDRAQGGAIEAVGLEHLARRVQDERALEVAHGLLPDGFPLLRHYPSRSGLTLF